MVAERKPVNRSEQKRKIRKLVEKQEKRSVAKDSVKARMRNLRSLKDQLKQASSPSEKKAILERLKGMVLRLENSVADVKEAMKDVSEARFDAREAVSESGTDVSVAAAESVESALSPMGGAAPSVSVETSSEAAKPVLNENNAENAAPEDALAAVAVGAVVGAAAEEAVKADASDDKSVSDAAVNDVVAPDAVKPDEKAVADIAAAAVTVALADEMIGNTGKPDVTVTETAAEVAKAEANDALPPMENGEKKNTSDKVNVAPESLAAYLTDTDIVNNESATKSKEKRNLAKTKEKLLALVKNGKKASKVINNVSRIIKAKKSRTGSR